MTLLQAISERWGFYGPLVALLPPSKVGAGQIPESCIVDVADQNGQRLVRVALPYATINESGQMGAVRTNTSRLDTVGVRIDVYAATLGELDRILATLRDWFGSQCKAFDCVADMKFTGRQKIQEDDGTWHLVTNWQCRTNEMASV